MQKGETAGYQKAPRPAQLLRIAPDITVDRHPLGHHCRRGLALVLGRRARAPSDPRRSPCRSHEGSWAAPASNLEPASASPR